jgi:hypothetical protein
MNSELAHESGQSPETRPQSRFQSTPEINEIPNGMAELGQAVYCSDLAERISGLGLPPEIKERIKFFILDSGSGRSRDVSRLEAAIEELPDKIEAIGLMEWGHICQTVLPELYGEPPQSFKASHSLPGSKARIWRLGERFRLGYSLFHPRDSLGVRANSLQLSMFDEKIDRAEK